MEQHGAGGGGAGVQPASVESDGERGQSGVGGAIGVRQAPTPSRESPKRAFDRGADPDACCFFMKQAKTALLTAALGIFCVNG